MKKIISLVLVCIMAAAICVPAFATAASPIEDITADVKFTTALEVYTKLLPVVRTDAQFISWDSYTNGGVDGFKAPGSGTRTVTMYDFPFVNFFNDRFVVDVSKADQYVYLAYSSGWANVSDNCPHGELVYNVDIPADGIYEFVVVGCAQIKDAAVDDDSKDRGFTISVDGGTRRQVNISDTQLSFRDYSYDYSVNDVPTTNITTKNGVNSKYYQVGYVQNITFELTKGTHTIEFTHLYNSGATEMSGNGSRLNFMGIYVQEFLTDVELAAYTYPATEPIVETTAPETTKPETTKAADTTAEPKVDTTAAPTAGETTAAPVNTKDNDTQTEPAAQSGCGSIVGCGAVVLVTILGSALVASKRK